MTSLKEQLIHALMRVQTIPGMKKALQPTIKYLKKPQIIVPENDYVKIYELSELIYRIHYKKIKTHEDKENMKLLTDLANSHFNKPSKKSRS